MNFMAVLVFVHQLHQINVIAQKYFGRIDATLLRSVFQFEHAARTYGRANTTTHTTGPYNVLAFLGIGPHIDAHLAIGGAIATGNALASVGGYPKF
jgi:hypothetical protein